MQLDQTERLASLVASALECAADERAQFLNDVCGDDAALLQEAESLLRLEERARDFLEGPAFEMAEDIIVEQTPPAAELPSEPTDAIDSSIDIEPEPEIAAPEPEAAAPELETAAPEPNISFRKLPPIARSKERITIAQFDLYDVGRIVAVGLLLVAVIALIGVRRKVERLRHERDNAQTERARAEHVSDFLRRTFSFSEQNLTSVWPVPARKQETVSEMLDHIAPRIEKEFAARSDLRAEMQRMVGSAYAAQGKYDAAEKNLRAAFGAQTRLHGEENPEAVSTMLELGILSDRQLKPDEAQRLLEEAVSFYRTQREKKSSAYNAAKFALALGYLGEVKFNQGDTATGLSHLSEALQISSTANLKGVERSVLIFNKGRLGAAFVKLGETEKGETLLQEAIREFRTDSSEPRWEVGEFVMMLGLAALNKDQPDDALKYFDESAEIFRRTIGDKNLYLVSNLDYQAAAFAVKGDFKTAEGRARDCVALSRMVSPGNKLPWAGPLRTLGNILSLAGQTKEGEDYYREALTICERQPTKNFSLIVPLKIQLCHLLLAQKRLTEAENMAFEAQNEARQHFDEQDPVREAATTNLVQIYKKQGKDDVAQTVR
jgi:tetratricopeptide (TPR) repeat protein